ncbi:MAG: hypothetical protein K2O05_01590, partial [Anaeroplasmataceae bacterium]|nr:hypothetical protein [Anaeroplasmataceae bacterium]
MNYDLTTLEFPKVLSILEGYAKTQAAKKKIKDLTPSFNYEEITVLQEETKEAYLSLVKLDGLPLEDLPSIQESLKKASMGGILEAQELLDIVSLLNIGLGIEKYFKTLSAMKVEVPNLTKYSSCFVDFPTLKTNITLAIKEDGTIADNASRELFTIRRSLSSLQNRLRSKLNELLASKANMLTESLIVMRDGKMCLPVKIEYKNTFKGIVHDVSSSNTTCY